MVFELRHYEGLKLQTVASILSTTTEADGFVLVPRDLEGYPAGEAVLVHLYDLP